MTLHKVRLHLGRAFEDGNLVRYPPPVSARSPLAFSRAEQYRITHEPQRSLPEIRLVLAAQPLHQALHDLALPREFLSRDRVSFEMVICCSSSSSLTLTLTQACGDEVSRGAAPVVLV